MKIIFETTANEAVVSEHTKALLREIAGEAGLTHIYISSTQREPDDQARAMYDNCEVTGVARQMTLYRAPGQAIVKTYAQCKARRMGRADTIAEMARAIREVGPSKVSRHCADPSEGRDVVDVRPSRMPAAARSKFIAAARRAVEAGRVAKFLGPPNDPAFHLEVMRPEGARA
ncbi:MAG: hypothetical protein ACXW5J_26695 [Thermoanaerobaculia bacterium]